MLLQVEHVVHPVLPFPLHAVHVLSTDPHLGHFTMVPPSVRVLLLQGADPTVSRLSEAGEVVSPALA